jgi:hypothetical protein
MNPTVLIDCAIDRNAFDYQIVRSIYQLRRLVMICQQAGFDLPVNGGLLVSHRLFFGRNASDSLIGSVIRLVDVVISLADYPLIGLREAVYRLSRQYEKPTIVFVSAPPVPAIFSYMPVKTPLRKYDRLADIPRLVREYLDLNGREMITAFAE